MVRTMLAIALAFPLIPSSFSMSRRLAMMASLSVARGLSCFPMVGDLSGAGPNLSAATLRAFRKSAMRCLCSSIGFTG